MDQEPLWLTEPGRRTCLATVQAVDGDWFLPDRAVFAPSSRACRHPQPADKGTVWVDGSKRRLAGVRATRTPQGSLQAWYRLRDHAPSVGAKLQCEVDGRWRDAMARGHTLMHLWIAAVAADGVAMTADPEVRGDGHARLTVDGFIAPPTLKVWLDRVQAWIDADTPVGRGFVDRAEASRRATPQPFRPPDPVPGGDAMCLVDVPGVCALPCDGVHVNRTGRLGRAVVVHAAPGKGGFVLVSRSR